MERKFYINWHALVEEAKQRRKSQKLTQKQLAKFAKVSTPTISRFENGAKDIQLSSILNILGMLGMVDKRRLDFQTKPAKYLFDQGIVRFIGQDGDKKVICEISKETLDDLFHGDGNDPIKTFKANQSAIEQKARRKYIDGQISATGIISIKSEDL